MGRRTGVTSEETRRELLAAALTVLLARGYEGTRVSEIAREAGVTSGAIYNHFSSKAELLEAAIVEHAPDALDELLGTAAGGSVLAGFRQAGAVLPGQAEVMGPLVIELVATARRDAEIAKVLRRDLSAKERVAADVIRAGQDAGEVDSALDADALARATTMLALGALVAASIELKPVDDAAWHEVLGRLLDGVRPSAASPTPGGPPAAGPATAGLAPVGPTAAGPATAGLAPVGSTAAGSATAGPAPVGPPAAGPATAGPTDEGAGAPT